MAACCPWLSTRPLEGGSLTLLLPSLPVACLCVSVSASAAAAELEQLVPAGSFAGALRTAVLQGRRQMVYHMSQHEAVQTMEPGIMAGILGTAIYHRR